MTRSLALTFLTLILVGCSSVEEREPDSASEISLAEVAQRVGGELTYVPESGKGVIEADSGQFIVVAGMDRALFNGTEYALEAPAVIIAGDIYIPRRFFNIHLSRSFAIASARRRVDQALNVNLPRPSMRRPVPAVTPGRKGTGLAGLSILIDAGHGGKDPGASYGGVTEKQLNTAVAKMVIAGLRARGARVKSTRSGDNYVSLDQRVQAGNGSGLFVSIHANAFKNTSVHGVEVYHQADRPSTSQAKELAAHIIRNVVGKTGARNRGVRRDVRGLRVLRKSKIPAVLVEMGYMSNPSELAQLRDPSYQKRIAEGIVAGIESYAGGRLHSSE